MEISKKEMSGPKKVTLSLNHEVYERFQLFCRERDIMLSKRVERLIKQHLEEQKREREK